MVNHYAMNFDLERTRRTFPCLLRASAVNFCSFPIRDHPR